MALTRIPEIASARYPARLWPPLLAHPLVAVLPSPAAAATPTPAPGPLDNALGYLPEDAPLVVTIDTDVEGGQFKSIDKIADRFPFATRSRSS